jgi:hypothetical protein
MDDCDREKLALWTTYHPTEVTRERPCPRAACDCHIGYVHLEELGLDAVFGDDILVRIPMDVPERNAADVSTYVSATGR